MYDIPLMRRLRSRLQSEKDPQKLKTICDVFQMMIEENESAVALRLKLMGKRIKRLLNSR